MKLNSEYIIYLLSFMSASYTIYLVNGRMRETIDIKNQAGIIIIIFIATLASQNMLGYKLGNLLQENPKKKIEISKTGGLLVINIISLIFLFFSFSEVGFERLKNTLIKISNTEESIY